MTFVQSKSTKSVRSLIWAEMSFRASLSVCDFVLMNPDVLKNSHLKHGILSGLATNYGRPFTENSGLANIKDKLVSKMDKNALGVHTSLLELRHKVYAHKNDNNNSDPTPKNERVTLIFTSEGRLKSRAVGLTFLVDATIREHLNGRVEDVRSIIKTELTGDLSGKLTQFGSYWVEDNGYRLQDEK